VTVRVVKATVDHALQVAEFMREADRAEVWASSHSTPWQATTDSLRVSTAAWAGLYDDRAVCVFGVAPLNMIAGIGSPWLLGTEELVERPAAFLRRCRPYVGKMLRVYPTLVNNVDDRNEASKRWLEWLGFTLGDPRPHGPDGVPFRPFKLEVPCVRTD
jgi:hypothetical protein